MKTPRFSLPLAVGLVVATSTVAAQEWTRFRGPNGSGISHARTIPGKITDADINWKIELPGIGHSSPVLWADRIFLTTTGDKAGGFSALCLSTRDGRLLWRHDFPLTPFPRHPYNSYASSTPAVDADHVYVVWNEPEHYYLAALDHDGKLVWQRDFGPFVSQHGCGISPMLYQGKVFLGDEQDDAHFVPGGTRTGNSSVLAVDARTGETVWQTPRRSVVVAYATPCVYEPKDAKAQIIFSSQGGGLYATDPDTGKILWDYDQAFNKRCVSSPLIAGDIILGSCGSGGGGNFVTAVRLADSANGPKPSLAWQLRRSAPYVPTGIVLGDRAWFWSDGGIVTCLDPRTGDVHYQERVGGDYFGSPVWVNGRLYCVSVTGDLVVVTAGDKFEALCRYPLKELCRSTPAVALGRMFIRTEKHLWCLGGKPADP
ncbi:MAG: PQQ-binding-like beta-propeller repeat protein [Verrucomicrobia bacterium]|nr:PQQ-binding-like beta-propeller repeat protein [Verrucomicrobiota bacterium]